MPRAFFRRAMENSVLIGMRVLDMHGRITHVNPAFCRMTGWDETDLVGKVAPFPYWPKDNYPEMQRQLDMTLRGKAPSSGFELRVRRKDSSFFHARLYVSPLIDSSGRQTGWMSSMTDITEPKRAREDLAAAHERFTTVLESLDAAVSVLAADEAELLFANRYYRHLFGIRPDGHLELAGAGFDTAQASSDSIDMVDTYAGLPVTALTESTADAQEVYVESIQKWFEVRRQYIQWVDGHLAQMQIATDITTRKQAQELADQQEEKAPVHQPADDHGRDGVIACARAEPTACRDQQLLLGLRRAREIGPHDPGRAASRARENRAAGGTRRHDHQADPRIREAQRAETPAHSCSRYRRGRGRPGGKSRPASARSAS